MRIRDLFLVLLLTCTFLSAAQGSDGASGPLAGTVPATAEQLNALQQFQQAHPAARLYSEAGQLVRVYGTTMEVGQSPTDTAAKFVAANSTIFACPAGDLQPMSRLEDRRHTQPLMFNSRTGEYKFTLVYYSQYRDGLPVYGSDLRLLVRNAESSPLVLAASSLRYLGEFGVDPILANMEFDPAVQAHTGMTRFTRVEKIIWAGLEGPAVEPVLAVTFIGENDRTDAGHESWRFVCDARTGEVLHKETMIHFVDVNGTVKAMATPGAKAAICTDEILFNYPWARVDIQGGSSVYADINGNFTIPNSGTAPVTVHSYVDGLYFTIDNRAGSEETLTATVTPPGPVNFVHCSTITDLVLAQTNIYVSGNACRDWILTQNPSFPSIPTETGVLTVVNRTDYYCPCNAWSDSGDGSINFCQPGVGSCTCPNTAWQSVLDHEYGHHCIDKTSSGQGEYGEGMADCIAMLPVDDPNLGYGFCSDCNQGLRTADNDCQYSATSCSSCGSEIHDCGMLLSGIVWSIRNQLFVTEPTDYLSLLSSIVVNSILLHTGTGINSQIAIDFLTLDDNDGNIYNGTPHYTEICAGFSAHGISCPALAVGMSVSPTSNFVSSGQAGGPFTPSSNNYTVENLGPASPITYNVTKTAPWLDITNATGSLTIGQTATVTVSINSTAASLPDGDYFDTLQFANTTTHVGDTSRTVTLRVGVNDDCVNAKRACPGQYYTGTNAGMTVDGSTSCGTSDATPDVWYKYTPGTSGSATFSLCSGTTYDSVLSVHSGCPGTAANTLSCNDDACGMTSNAPSEVTLSVTAGTTYLIRISGWSGATGNYTFNITGPECGSNALDVTIPDGAPQVIPPGLPTSFNVRIVDRDESYVPGSGLLHYRYTGGSFLTSPLTPLGGNLYQATFPAPMCGNTPQFYVSALGSGGTTVTSPATAPGTYYSAAVGTVTTIMNDAFETDQGWTVGDTGDTATTGIWTRNVPQATTAQPGSDHSDPGTMCWVTDYRAGSSAGDYDVDGGKTTVKSPMLNLSGYSQVTISYWRWYSNCAGGDPGADVFTVDISSNGGSTWTNVETVGPTGTGTCGGWYYHEYNVPGGMLTSQVKVRFVANDGSTPSLIEAAIDDFKVISFGCVDPATCHDGILNQGEVRIDCGGPCPPCDCTADAACSNGNFCDGVETCDAYGHCQPGANPCPGQWCDAEGCFTCSTHNGDMDGNGTADGKDIQHFVEALLTASASRHDVCPSDFNNNGVVDLGDVGGMVNKLLGH
ncbi:MAG TPA: hypothetical protein VMV94_19205 [Phycisphaerae bacterium]|nr:hypothetical protein [Phycisphaerae bacterium]